MFMVCEELNDVWRCFEAVPKGEPAPLACPRGASRRSPVIPRRLPIRKARLLPGPKLFVDRDCQRAEVPYEHHNIPRGAFV